MIEVIATNIDDCLLLNEYKHIGRIEFCAQMDKGGFTPDFNLVKSCLEISKLPIRVIIRNQESYDINPEELTKMCSQMAQFAALNIDGFVIGCNHQGKIDEIALQQIIQVAQSKKIIYHRAFDYLDDPISSLEILKNHGVHGILTSGRRGNVDQSSIENLQIYTQSGLEIVIGGGVKRENFAQFKNISSVHLGSDLRFDSDFNNALDPARVADLAKL